MRYLRCLLVLFCEALTWRYFWGACLDGVEGVVVVQNSSQELS